MNDQHAETANPLRDEKTTGTEIRPTICSICNPGSHCGVDAYVKNERIIKVKGSKETHNAGTLCAKGAAGLQYVYHPDRLTTPLIRTGERGSGRFEPASWKDALNLISNRLNEIKTETGPESVIFYAGYPKWMRPFLKRLAHSFGSPNYASESSTCHTAVKLADVVLPACSSYERSELKFYPENRILWTRPAIEPIGQSRSDADIIFDLAETMAPDDDLLRSGYEASVDWILKPSGFKVADLKQYPRGLIVHDVSIPPYRKYEKEGFKTPSGKMEFTSLVLANHGLNSLPVYREPVLSPISTPEKAKDFPLILTTGARLPFFIHSRAYRIPRLRRLQPDPMADLNPADARKRDLRNVGCHVSAFSI